jgi:hypothetical protein
MRDVIEAPFNVRIEHMPGLACGVIEALQSHHALIDRGGSRSYSAQTSPPILALELA